MTTGERVRYRRLPGRRRGILRGSGVWLGADHLLLVRSTRFREEYKRFHLRDIQAIAMAVAPRFHISTRSIGIGIVWMIGLSFAYSRGSGALQNLLWISGIALVVAWVYISANCSCVCRIYTAVSGDNLPSVYRSWTARRFMHSVEPQIATAQGTAPGEQGDAWVEELESRRIGPREEPSVMQATKPGAGSPGAGPETRTVRESRWPLKEIFVAAMFADAVLSYGEVHRWTKTIERLGYATLAIEVAISIALLVQHKRGRVGAGIQRVVIASLVLTGISMYLGPVMTGAFTAAANAGRTSPAIATARTVLSNFDVGAHLLLGLTALGLTVAGRGRRQRVSAD